MEDDPKWLFYAAFELRCCVESRQAEYAEALVRYENTKIRAWNIGETGKRIRKASYADRISHCRYKISELVIDSYHTPVPDRLVALAERELNPLLHSQNILREGTDPWWQKTRATLIEVYRMAWLSCQGDSLVPPIWNPRTRDVHPMRIEQHERSAAFFELFPIQPGTQFEVSVNYLTDPPHEWVCDL
jgi:hypothetical protein